MEKFADGYEGDDPESWDRRVITADLLLRFLISAPAVEDTEVVTDIGELRHALTEAGSDAFHRKLETWDSMGEQYNAPDITERLLSNVMLQVLDEKW